MKTLKIAKNLSLPLDLVTQAIAVLAKRRAGKSYAMRRICEQLFKAGQQIVLVDPKGDQWGIRYAADGRGPGLPVIILGGEHGDVPLEPGAGEVVANLVVKERVSVVLDLSLFRKHEVATFMSAFLENLYRLKARETYRTPLSLVIDEADAIAPQKPQRGEERMLGAAEDIVRRGGQRGLGCILVTQRSAVLNKNVLTQVQMLVVLRTIAPQDLAAMDAWIDVHGEPSQRRVLRESLPSLPVGDAWFWSPGWPTADGIFQRSHVLPIETFDSGATPRPGAKPVVPKTAADIDLEALRRQMAATIEKAVADDPRALRAKIAELERQVKAKPAAPAAPLKSVEVRVLGRSDMRDLRRAVGAMGKHAARMEALNKGWDESVIAIIGTLKKLGDIVSHATGSPVSPWGNRKADVGRIVDQALKSVREVNGHMQAMVDAQPPRFVPGAASPHLRSEESPSGNGRIQPAQQRLLNALAWLLSIGRTSAERQVVAFVAGASSKSSAFVNNLSALRTAGYLSYPGSNLLSLTDKGKAQAVAPNSPLTDRDLHSQIERLLQPAQWRIVRAAIDAHPRALSREELAAKAGASISSSAFVNNVSRVRSLGLIDYPERNLVAATRLLFVES